VISTIYRIRNHPSLLLWTGGNEGHARKELYDVMRNSIITLDGTRPFIPSSSGFANLPEGWEGSWPDGGPAGVYSSGPYQWRDPLEYFEKSDQGKDWVFKDETGIPSQPTYNSLVKMFPNLIWDKNAPFPLNDTWGYHDAATGNGRYDRYYDDMVRQFGKPQSIEDFSNKMQLMNAMGYQAIFEGPSHLLHKTGGVMLWKLNAAFPSVIWQIYDWYLQPNAGYYFMQNACEPVHIQFNRHHAKIGVVNRMHEDFSNLEVNVQLFDFKSKLLFEDQATINVGADQAVESIDLSEVIKNNSGLKLLVLNLRDVEQTNISHNVYWLEDANDFTNLSQMPKTKVTAVVENLQQISGEKEVTIRFSNNTGQLAFFIRPQIMLADEEILPSYWSASYFSLAPGESITTKVRYEDKTTMGKTPILKVSAWNMDIVEAALP
jgi:beta-galactosidase/beta-glucuronidase